MIIDALTSNVEAMPDLDVLIVGSGPVGLTLARALDRRGVRVLILEAGPREYALPRTGICDVIQEGEFLGSVAVARTRQVGGGLNLWGGQLGLLEPIDTEDVNTWPLRHSEVYEYLEEALAIAGLKGGNVAERLRKSFNPPPKEETLSNNIHLVETAWLPRPKFDRGFWRWLEASETCHLWHSAACVGLEGGHTSFARVRVAIGSSLSRLTSIDAKHVVLAAGTLENARLLMLPASSSQAQPWMHNRWLGRGFNDHLDASVGRLVCSDRRGLAQLFDPYVRGGIKYLPKIVWTDRKSTSTGLGACGLPAYSLASGQVMQDVGLLFKNLIHQPSASIAYFPKALLNSARSMAPLVARYLASRRIGRPSNSEVRFRVSIEQRALWQSGVRLSDREKDCTGLPRCILTWQRGDAELQAMNEFAQAANQWFIRRKLGRIEIEPSLAAQAPEFWDRVDSGLHHAGTTRMGRNEHEGVVDPHLRVFGARHVYVCGASVFPSSGYVNPTLTAMSLAVRLAAQLTSLRSDA